MDEYQRLYNLYIKKTDSELQEILNSGDDYTEIAIKVASDILSSGRISHEETIEKPSDDNISLPDEKKEKKFTNTPVWLLIIALISGLVAGAVLTSAFFDLQHAANDKKTTNKIVGNFYDGTGDYFGVVFNFYDENTYRCFTSSGNNFRYGTYDIKENALTLKISNETCSAVIVDDGNKIMISDSELHKTTDSKQISKYRSIVEDADADGP